ncbi:MAG TPA: 3'-5' exonuclease [Anaerolineae bacterium]|jgi:DNA polymerase III epsilon subunit-like protein
MRLPLAKVRPHITFDRKNFTLNVELLAAPLPPEQAVGLTPSGLLLPPGVAQKLSARAALAEAEALLESLPAAPETTHRQLPTPAGLEEADVLAEAEAILDPAVQALQAIVSDQARAAEALAQAAAIVEQRRPPAAPDRVHPTIPAGVAAQARAILAQHPLFLDYETTGLRRGVQVEELPSGGYSTTATAKYHQVVEVAVIDAGGRPVFHSWVDPQRPIPAGASQHHGLAAADLAGAPAWAEVAPLLGRLLAGRLVVAHNAAFEALFTPPQWGISWACTYELSNQAFGRFDFMDARYDWRKSGSLPNRLRQCGLKPGPGHTAAGDCLSTLRLLRYLAGLEQTC